MSKVIVQECNNYEPEKVIERINVAVEILGGWDKFVKPRDKVLLKVNLIGPKSSDSAAVTHAEFVRALVRILKGRGCNMCVESCPVEAIDKDTKGIDYDACIECMCCHKLCMFKAVELKNSNKIAGLISGHFRK